MFLDIDEHFRKNMQPKAKSSGSTAVVVLFRDSHLWIANAGDSRAVVASIAEDGSLSSKDLSRDHNPDTPGERERIIASGGFVMPPPEPGLSARMYTDKKMTKYGLAMARSLGDLVVKNYGISAEPEARVRARPPEKERACQFSFLSS